MSTALLGSLLAGAAYAADDAAAPPPPGARSAGQPGVSPPGIEPGVGAGASTNATGAAQQRLDQGRTAPSEANTVSEIVVTAEKREQSLQQVPVAVTAFTAARRDLIGIQSIVDQTNYTPGLTYQPSLDRVSLRGVGRLTNAHTADSGTALYVDGVFTTSTTEAGRDPLFVERTEILRGPQGTLYGRNSIGGAYNTISRHPDAQLTGEARVEVGNYDLQDYSARISGPITDWLRFSLGYQHVYQGDGYEKNLTGLSDEDGVRDRDYYEVQFEGNLGKLDFWAYYGKQNWNDRSVPGGGVHNGGSFVPPEISTNGVGSIYPLASYGFTNGLNTQFTGPIRGNPNLATGDLRVFETDQAFNDKLDHNDVARMHLTYHFPDFDLKYIGGFVRYDYHYIADTDGTSVSSYQVPLAANAGPVTTIPGIGPVTCAQLQALGMCGPATVFPNVVNQYDENEEFYSHEINIASTWDSPLQYIAGLYFYREYSNQPQDVFGSSQPQLATPVSAVATVAAVPNPTRSYVHTNFFANIDSKAVFAQLDYKLIPQIKLTGGVRYTQDDKKVTEEERILCYGLASCGAPLTTFGSLAPAVDITLTQNGTLTAAQIAAGVKQQGVVSGVIYDPTTGYAKRRLQDGSNDVTGTAGVEWTPDRRTLAYARYSRGYKAFGFNATVASGLSQFPYTKPEQMNAFELGLKRDWTRRFQTNITAFYDLYYDAQVPLSIPQAAGPSLSVFYNIPKSTIRGVELESIWSPIDKLNLSLTYGYLDAFINNATGVADPNDPTATFPGARPSAGNTLGAVDAITGLPSRGQDLKGQQLPLSPKHKIAANANYDFDLGRWGDLIPSISYIYRSEQYSSIFNRYYNFSPSRDQIDIRVTYKAPGNRFEIIGYAANITDSTNYEYRTGTRYSTGAVYENYFLTDPRTYGVQLQARF